MEIPKPVDPAVAAAHRFCEFQLGTLRFAINGETKAASCDEFNPFSGALGSLIADNVSNGRADLAEIFRATLIAGRVIHVTAVGEGPHSSKCTWNKPIE